MMKALKTGVSACSSARRWCSPCSFGRTAQTVRSRSQRAYRVDPALKVGHRSTEESLNREIA